MTGLGTGALAVGWALAVLALAWRRRPGPRRVQRLADLPAQDGATDHSLRRTPRAGILMEAIGSRLLGLLGLQSSPERCRRVGTAVVAGITAASVSLALVPVAAVLAWIAPRTLATRRQRRRRAAMAADLPDVVDLFSLVVGAGLTVSFAVREVARRGTGPLSEELAKVGEAVALGRRLADALEELPNPQRGGEAARGLAAALVASERYGAQLAPALDRLSLEVRADRRRLAEEAARKVPVKLLFPLVTCTLPAFALLTVAPLIASAIRSLRL